MKNIKFNEFINKNSKYNYLKLISNKIQEKLDVLNNEKNILIFRMPPRSFKTHLTISLINNFINNNRDKNVSLFTYSKEIGNMIYKEIIRLNPIEIVDTIKLNLRYYHMLEMIHTYVIDLMIIDDYCKGPSEIKNIRMAEEIIKCFDHNILYLNKNSLIIIFTTFRYENDIIYRIFNNSKYENIFKYEYISIPAISIQSNDFLNRDIGESYCDERYRIDTLKEMENKIGKEWFEALYQGKFIKNDTTRSSSIS